MIDDRIGTDRPVRWAVLGTGAVSRKFVIGLRALDGAAVVSVVASRTPSNAVRFAKELGCHRAVRTYAEAVEAADVDAVYIATPPSEHEVHACLAIDAGKATLVEKPFALDSDAAQRIATAAHAAGVFCMEAMWTRFMPIIAAIDQQITTGAIGQLRSFEGSFLGADEVDRTASQFDPERGGGALMHRGVYAVSLARHFVGPIVETRALARIGPTGVDDECSLVLRHRSGAVSTIRASLSTNGQNGFTLYGSIGRVEVAGPIYRPTSAHVIRSLPRPPADATRGHRFESLRERGALNTFRQRAGPLLMKARQRSSRIAAPYAGNGYHYEAAAVAAALSTGTLDSSVMPLAESIEIMRVIDTARADWDIGSLR